MLPMFWISHWALGVGSGGINYQKPNSIKVITQRIPWENNSNNKKEELTEVLYNKWDILKWYISNRMHIGWNKKVTGDKAIILENVDRGKRNIWEGMHVRINSENKSSGLNMEVKMRKPSFSRALICYLHDSYGNGPFFHHSFFF